MSDFGRMREFAVMQADYIDELESIIEGLPATSKSKFPTRPAELDEMMALIASPEPPQPEPAPASEPAPEPAA